jgi:hypothetical protein
MLGHSIVSQHFMEPVGSILNSQELSTCSYPQPVHVTCYKKYNISETGSILLSGEGETLTPLGPLEIAISITGRLRD